MDPSRKFVPTLSRLDRERVVGSVSGLLCQAGCNTFDSQRFGDAESVVLARAVRWQVQHRVLLNGRKTLVLQ